MKENPSLLDDFSNRRLLALAALTVLLLFVFYLPTLFSGYEWYFSDITYFFEPFCRFVRSNIQNGIFPLWNPYLYSGMPQLAMPCPGLFYPMSWFMFLMPFSAGLSSYMIFHHIILGIGSYVYLRDLKFTRAASIFGAIAVTLCGYNFSFVRNCTLPVLGVFGMATFLALFRASYHNSQWQKPTHKYAGFGILRVDDDARRPAGSGRA